MKTSKKSVDKASVNLSEACEDGFFMTNNSAIGRLIFQKIE